MSQEKYDRPLADLAELPGPAESSRLDAPAHRSNGMMHVDVVLSVVIVLRDPDEMMPVGKLFRDYKCQLDTTGLRYEWIVVIDGDHPALLQEVISLKEREIEDLTIVSLGRWSGDATALSIGFERAAGEIILTLPARHEIDPVRIPDFIDQLDGSDMVIIRRWPRRDGWINGAATRIFHWTLNRMVGSDYHDITCGVRLFRTEVAETVRIYGDQHRFFPVLVNRFGFKVREVAAAQFEERRRNRFGLASYVRRALDLLSVFFLVKFTKKPLRFFGVSGLIVFLMGAIFSSFLAYQRIFLDQPLADRPALLLGLLFMVLGVQLFAIGIVGELVIFTHSKNVREYAVERIIN